MFVIQEGGRIRHLHRRQRADVETITREQVRAATVFPTRKFLF
jgi:hypothetical protein